MKKKIVVFSSTGGGGHISVSEALKSYLENDYKVKIVYPYAEILHPLDFIRILSLNRYNAEKMYNVFAKKRLFSIINAIYYISQYYIKLRKQRIEELFDSFLEKEQPNLIISVVPVINGEILAVAQKRDIPFLIIPTDLDATTFILDINNAWYEKFHMGLSFDLQKIIKTLGPAHIDPVYYSFIGFPLRTEFFKAYNKSDIKKEFGIPKNKSVVLFMLGSIGSEAFIDFVNQMKNIKNPCHIIICLGKSENLRNTIKTIQLPNYISTSILGFNKRIAELMSISDLFVTKSGTVSVCEALYMNLPLLLDATGTVLTWEQFNHGFILEQGFGDILYNKNEIAKKIDLFLKNPEKLAECRNNLKNFEKKPFNKYIHILTQYMIGEKTVQHILKFMYDFL